jgi:hypothetical protein
MLSKRHAGNPARQCYRLPPGTGLCHSFLSSSKTSKEVEAAASEAAVRSGTGAEPDRASRRRPGCPRRPTGASRSSRSRATRAFNRAISPSRAASCPASPRIGPCCKAILPSPHRAMPTSSARRHRMRAWCQVRCDGTCSSKDAGRTIVTLTCSLMPPRETSRMVQGTLYKPSLNNAVALNKVRFLGYCRFSIRHRRWSFISRQRALHVGPKRNDVD